MLLVSHLVKVEWWLSVAHFTEFCAKMCTSHNFSST